MSNDVRATIGSVGDWGGREEYAARRWNDFVLPILEKIAAQCEGDEDTPKNEDMLAQAQQDAWDAFCSSGSRAAIRAAKKYLAAQAEWRS